MFLGSPNGLGRAIYDNYLAYRVPEMYVFIVLSGIVGFLANKAFLTIERRLSFWLPDWR
jgi:ABC-type nitrate/sulfonate/bicarbonate transport system permease component